MSLSSTTNSVCVFFGDMFKKHQFEIVLTVHYMIWAMAFFFANNLQVNWWPFVVSAVFIAIMEGVAGTMKPKLWGTVVPLILSLLFAGITSVYVIYNPNLYVWLVLGMWVDGFMTAFFKLVTVAAWNW